MKLANMAVWQALGAFIVASVLSGCDDTGHSDDGALDERLASFLERIEDPRSYTDEQYALALMSDLEELTSDEEVTLVGAIDDRYGERASLRSKSANVPVLWSYWPSGKKASASGVTTACGGDPDIWLRFSSVSNAYASPSSLRLYTNSVYVYGAMYAHNYRALAYLITPSNTVNFCIGMGGLNGPAVQGAFISGLSLQ